MWSALTLRNCHSRGVLLLHRIVTYMESILLFFIQSNMRDKEDKRGGEEFEI
jgi:hypothetical protein